MAIPDPKNISNLINNSVTNPIDCPRALDLNL